VSELSKICTSAW